MPHGQVPCLVRIISLLTDGQLLKEKIGDRQYWTNLFIPLNTSQVCSLNRWPALKRENWTWSEEKDWQYWTNLFIPLNASQVCLLHGVSWQVFLCVRIKAQSQLHLYRKIISINVWHARNHHVVLISQNRVKSVTQNLLLREYQNSIIFIQKWYVY